MKKKYICKLDAESKTVAVGDSTLTLINGRQYNESHITEKLPHLFELLEDLADDGIINGSNKIKKRKPKIEKKDSVDNLGVVEDNINITNNIIEDNQENTDVKVKKEKIKVINKDIKENKKIFSWTRLLLLFVSTITIAGISAYLRIHGISIIFKIDILYSAILVGGFVLSEFAIASLLLREIKSTAHAILNYLILGIIQIILIGMSFVFEFTTLSDWILVHKNKTEIVVKQQTTVEDTLKDYDIRIKSIQSQIEITPDTHITKRSKLTTELNKVIEEKNKEKSKIESMLKDTNTTDKLTESNGMESAAKVLHLDDSELTRGVLIIIASILNLLYLFFIYGFMTEWKRRNS